MYIISQKISLTWLKLENSEKFRYPQKDKFRKNIRKNPVIKGI